MSAIQSAFEHHKNGRLRQAEEIYRRVLKKNPDQFDALHMLGVLYLQLGKLDDARRYVERAVGINPTNDISRFNLGNILLRMGRFDDAILSYKEVIRLNPVFAEAYFNAGNAFREKGQLDEAVSFYRKTVELNRDHVHAHYNLGNLLTIRRELPEAIESYSRALTINPHHSDALLNRGFAYQVQGKFEEALEDYRRVLAATPDSLEVYNNLGNLMKDLGQLREAETCFRRAMQINPAFSVPYSNLLFLMNYDSRYNSEAVFSEHIRFAKKFEDPVKSAVVPHANEKITRRTLRVGYVSPDLRKHSVAYFLEPVLAAHNKQRFEIFCYSLVPAEDDVTERLRSFANRWLNISEMSDDRAAEVIRGDKVDILVDLAGHTANNRILLFARKPAPVQVTWIGYPATTGLSAMDYKVVDNYTDPAGMTERFYSERLIRIPGCFLCYLPDRESPDIGPLPCLSSDNITFGSFNNLAKVSHETIELWSEILQAVPGSRLILKAKSLSSNSTQGYITDIFAQKEISRERIELCAWQPSIKDHLDMYGRVDIALDTFPYNGATTTCEALWMGVPVVTLSGITHASRVGLSLLSNAGVSELAAASGAEYISIVTALATDRRKLQSLREGMRDMMIRSHLMDVGNFVHNIENCYRNIWENWCNAR